MPDDADLTGDTSLPTPGDSERDGTEYQIPPATGAPGDVPPKAKKGPGRPKGSKNKTRAEHGDKPPTEAADFRRLRKQLSEFLKGPAIVFETVGEDWPAKHVDTQAPNLADAIIDRARTDPKLKARLEAFLEGGATAGLVIAAVMYIVPLGIYFGVVPVPEGVKRRLMIPDRVQGLGAGPEMPPGMREAVEAEAKEKGFVDAFGNPDLNAYQAAIQDAANAVRGPGAN